MADEFSAGSIGVELKAQFDNLANGILQAQQQLTAFAKTTQQVASDVETSGRRMAQAQDDGSLGSLRAQERFARLGAQMIAMQAGLSSLASSTQKAFGEFNVAAGIGAVSFERFLMVFGSFPTVTSAVLGGAIALAEGFAMTSKAIDDINRKMDDLNKKLAATRQAFIAFQAKEDVKTSTLPGAQGEIQKVIDQQSQTIEKATLWLRQYADATAQADKDLPLLTKDIQDLTERIKILRSVDEPDPTIIAIREEELQKLVKQKIQIQDSVEGIRKSLSTLGIDIQNPDKKIQELTDHLVNLREALKLAGAEREIEGVLTKLDAIGTIGGREVQLGIVTPLQQGEKELAATKSAMEQILDIQLKIQQAANLVSGDEELQNALRARAEDLNETLGTLQGRAKNQQITTDAQKQAGVYAQGLASSIGNAVSQGILNGEKAMQILADVGRGLFANMLNQAVAGFQKGMVSAFQSIAGEGGEILGSALTGVLGVIGGIFSRKSGGTTSFNSVQSQIQSTEAVRGIVAGPTNVAIADVATDLTRANKPVVDKLEEIRLALLNLRFSGGGVGSLPFAGSVTTP